ncbi:ribose 1,5-bisphosphokinase [Chromohalobacter marismortui]|uniref:Ribose 1,5-bisphosphate phosphokinase PhnN n=1 Tax=Chromohalobacter marismortui TaxID=42055 RepID=A0A4R7NNW8_9GAMM|nr:MULTISPECIES: ribose 1,5-bisphosphokinase [Chromohalobacter]MCI0509549.1 ribose 1,5-bisphosphokinase [Chromohalobacter sp.]MCI0592557.1 ribose 1,5-bisphosphokinase [Chromohalobacter sp.]TDU22269.1 ribose 1,5-bisphosphokinase [Chromohalobacter marismortui]
MNIRHSPPGRLLYVMGASGVGKDSLLRELRRRRPDVLVAHRYITRSSGGGENCVELSAAEFVWRRAQGLFCLHWDAHGLDYGVGIEIETWLAAGHTVVLNGSRRALQKARERFGGTLVPLLIVAEAEVLRQRLIARGRETPAEIEARLARRGEEAALSDIARIDNGGELAEGVVALEAWLDASHLPEHSA